MIYRAQDRYSERGSLDGQMSYSLLTSQAAGRCHANSLFPENWEESLLKLDSNHHIPFI